MTVKSLAKISLFVLSFVVLVWLANYLVDSWYPPVSQVRQTVVVQGYNDLQQQVPTNSKMEVEVRFPRQWAIQGDRMNVTLAWDGDHPLRLIGLEINDDGNHNSTSFSRVLDPPTSLDEDGRVDLVWSIGQASRRTVKIVAYFDDQDPRYQVWVERAAETGVGAYAINGTRYPNFVATTSFSYFSIDQRATETIWFERILVSGLFGTFPFLTLLQFGGGLGMERTSNGPKPRSNGMAQTVQAPLEFPSEQNSREEVAAFARVKPVERTHRNQWSSTQLYLHGYRANGRTSNAADQKRER
jgi:hypothetical protein